MWIFLYFSRTSVYKVHYNLANEAINMPLLLVDCNFRDKTWRSMFEVYLKS